MRTHNKHITNNRKKKRVSNEEELDIILEKDKIFLFLILDGIQDPQNLGACMRSANVFGVDAVITPKNRSVALTDTARTISCGGADYTPFIAVSNLATTIKKLQNHNTTIIGTSDKAKQDIKNIDLKENIAIIMGSEEKGMRRLTEESCDYLVKIPVLGKVPCLNISVATGVSLYEVIRQRNS